MMYFHRISSVMEVKRSSQPPVEQLRIGPSVRDTSDITQPDRLRDIDARVRNVTDSRYQVRARIPLWNVRAKRGSTALSMRSRRDDVPYRRRSLTYRMKFKINTLPGASDDV